jgi:hypothetical protein
LYAGQGYLTDSDGQKVKGTSYDKVIKDYESAPEDFQFNNKIIFKVISQDLKLSDVSIQSGLSFAEMGFTDE